MKSNDEAKLLCMTTIGIIKLRGRDIDGTKVGISMVQCFCWLYNIKFILNPLEECKKSLIFINLLLFRQLSGPVKILRLM